MRVQYAGRGIRPSPPEISTVVQSIRLFLASKGQVQRSRHDTALSASSSILATALQQRKLIQAFSQLTQAPCGALSATATATEITSLQFTLTHPAFLMAAMRAGASPHWLKALIGLGTSSPPTRMSRPLR